MDIKRLVELIEKASSKKHTAIVHYEDAKKNKTYREVEFYKMIKDPIKKVHIFWVYDIKDGQIKKFYSSRILNVLISGREFVPRWDIEVGKTSIDSTGKSIDEGNT